MPAGLVKGDDAKDVAAYVGYAANRRGEDAGALAAGRPGGGHERRADLHGGRLRRLPQALQGRRERQHRPEPRRPGLVERRQAASPEEFVRQSILDPEAVVAKGYQAGVMPSFEGKLTDKQLQALVDYLLGN